MKYRATVTNRSGLEDTFDVEAATKNEAVAKAEMYGGICRCLREKVDMTILPSTVQATVNHDWMFHV